MPHGRNPESDARKSRIVSQLQNRFGSLERKYPARPDWYLLNDGKAEIFITDSKAHFKERPWFDMESPDIKELAAHAAGFVIFVLGEADNYLVVPAKDLHRELKNYIAGRRKVKKGFYHFNLPLPGKSFTQLPIWSLEPYRNQIELIGPFIAQ